MKKIIISLILIVNVAAVSAATSDPEPRAGGRMRAVGSGYPTIWRRGDVEARNERALTGRVSKPGLVTNTPEQITEKEVVTVPEDAAIYKQLNTNNPYEKPRFERLDRENVKTDVRESQKADPYDRVERPWDKEVRTPKDEVKAPSDERSERLERYDSHGNNRPENLERAKRLTPKDRQQQLMHSDAALKDGTRARNANFDEPTSKRLFGSPTLIEKSSYK